MHQFVLQHLPEYTSDERFHNSSIYSERRRDQHNHTVTVSPDFMHFDKYQTRLQMNERNKFTTIIVLNKFKTRGLSAWKLRCLIIHYLWYMYTTQWTPNDLDFTFKCQGQMSWDSKIIIIWFIIYTGMYVSCKIWYDAPSRRYNLLKVMWPWFDIERLSKVKCLEVNW